MEGLSKSKSIVSAFYESETPVLLLLLLGGDLVFILLHFLYQLKLGDSLIPFANDRLLSIEKDGGHAEWYQYLKHLWIVMLTGCICLKRKSFSYLSWTFFFLYLGMDDALQLHERFGKWIGFYLTSNPPFNLRPRDIGELLASALAGAILFSLLLIAYVRGSPSFRKASHTLGALVFVLVFFGLGVDTLHVALRSDPEFDLYLGALEDGGEMVATSFILWYTFYLFVQRQPAVVVGLSSRNAGVFYGSAIERQLGLQAIMSTGVPRRATLK